MGTRAEEVAHARLEKVGNRARKAHIPEPTEQSGARLVRKPNLRDEPGVGQRGAAWVGVGGRGAARLLRMNHVFPLRVSCIGNYIDLTSI